MTRRSTFPMAAAIVAAAIGVQAPADAGERRNGLQGDWQPARGEIQRRSFHERKSIKSLKAIWDALGDEGYHGFHDVRHGKGWVSCLAFKNGNLYRIRVDSETGSLISTRRVR